MELHAEVNSHEFGSKTNSLLKKSHFMSPWSLLLHEKTPPCADLNSKSEIPVSNYPGLLDPYDESCRERH